MLKPCLASSLEAVSIIVGTGVLAVGLRLDVKSLLSVCFSPERAAVKMRITGAVALKLALIDPDTAVECVLPDCHKADD